MRDNVSYRSETKLTPPKPAIRQNSAGAQSLSSLSMILKSQLTSTTSKLTQLRSSNSISVDLNEYLQSKDNKSQLGVRNDIAQPPNKNSEVDTKKRLEEITKEALHNVTLDKKTNTTKLLFKELSQLLKNVKEERDLEKSIEMYKAGLKALKEHVESLDKVVGTREDFDYKAHMLGAIDKQLADVDEYVSISGNAGTDKGRLGIVKKSSFDRYADATLYNVGSLSDNWGSERPPSKIEKSIGYLRVGIAIAKSNSRFENNTVKARIGYINDLNTMINNLQAIKAQGADKYGEVDGLIRQAKEEIAKANTQTNADFRNSIGDFNNDLLAREKARKGLK